MWSFPHSPEVEIRAFWDSAVSFEISAVSYENPAEYFNSKLCSFQKFRNTSAVNFELPHSLKSDFATLANKRKTFLIGKYSNFNFQRKSNTNFHNREFLGKKKTQ